MLCDASTTCYVFEITKTLEFMKNEKKIQHVQNYDMDIIITTHNNLRYVNYSMSK
jgi:hypothetical protein